MKKGMENFPAMCRAAGLPEPCPEARLQKMPGQRVPFRLDFAWLGHMVYLEIQGGIWAVRGAKRCRACGMIQRGAHAGGKGQERDIRKQNWAVTCGWTPILATPSQVKDLSILPIVGDILKAKKGGSK
jgi:hypothetical protein